MKQIVCLPIPTHEISFKLKHIKLFSFLCQLLFLNTTTTCNILFYLGWFDLDEPLEDEDTQSPEEDDLGTKH